MLAEALVVIPLVVVIPSEARDQGSCLRRGPRAANRN
jgi:hypothetical protein